MSNQRPDPLAPPEGYGIKPGQEPAPVASSTCTYNSGMCPAAPVVLVKLGCVGEHIAELYFCAPHWADISTHGLAWQCRGIENRGCGNPMRVEAVLMLHPDAASQVAAEVQKIRGVQQGAVSAAVEWATDGRPDTWYKPVWTDHGYEQPGPDDDPQTGLERVREAVRKARGGDPPAQPGGYA